VVRSIVRIVKETTSQIETLANQLETSFEGHPDAEILRSIPGLGSVLGARVLAEFGDDPIRYADPKARKNYAGTSPISKASGRSKVALARFARNHRLADALQMWAFCSLGSSPGARRYYHAHRAKGHTHQRALRSPSRTDGSASFTGVSAIGRGTRRPPLGRRPSRSPLDR
jgi:transposase